MTDRKTVHDLTEIVNIGKSVAGDLRRIGVHDAQQLIGRDPWEIYRKICRHDGVVHDPCLVDVLMSAVEYMNGGSPKKWWKFTARRKKVYGDKLHAMATPRAIAKHVSASTKKRRSKIASA